MNLDPRGTGWVGLQRGQRGYTPWQANTHRANKPTHTKQTSQHTHVS